MVGLFGVKASRIFKLVFAEEVSMGWVMFKQDTYCAVVEVVLVYFLVQIICLCPTSRSCRSFVPFTLMAKFPCHWQVGSSCFSLSLCRWSL